ncbi:MAG: PspC domain-containing protein [Gammaproteobacteria bacterium]|nr:PspC domain-containing protein [Gammaproteobacteria bacterium]MDH5303185.1 PspC domain-containing protein [Gammaproteobacteria bacterium]MDH5320807.1 PspC domain-containing protein [Gammaproteobacteria bacterium]
MTTYETFASRRFYRSADRAILGGVCAGVADSFGFNLRVLRVLVLIAFFVAMPMTIIVYLAIVFLVPARTGLRHPSVYEDWVASASRSSRKQRRAERKRARRHAKQESSNVEAEAALRLRRKCQSLEQRLASLEKYITSSRYQLDDEFRRL